MSPTVRPIIWHIGIQHVGGHLWAGQIELRAARDGPHHCSDFYSGFFEKPFRILAISSAEGGQSVSHVLQ